MDTVNGSPENDTIVGTAGNDTFNGLAGDDLILGGPGDDTLNGDAGNDTIIGGAGNDRIDGGPGANFLAGGEGGDAFDVRSGADTIHDTLADLNGDTVSGFGLGRRTRHRWIADRSLCHHQGRGDGNAQRRRIDGRCWTGTFRAVILWRLRAALAPMPIRS